MENKTRTKTVTITCEKCGEEVEMEQYELLDITDNPEVVANIFNGKMFSYTCKECGANEYKGYNFDVYDGNHQLYIKMDNDVNLINRYYDVIMPNNGLNPEYGIKEIGVSCIGELQDLLAALAFNLDYLTLRYYNKMYEVNMSKRFRQEYNCQSISNRHSACFVENGELTTTIYFDYVDEDGSKEKADMTFGFNQEIYDMAKEKVEKRCHGKEFYMYNDDVIDKIGKNTTYYGGTYVAEVRVAGTDEIKLVVNEDYDLGNYEVGDFVVFSDNKTHLGTITRFIDVDSNDFFIDIDIMPRLTWHYQNMKMNELADNDAVVDNDDVIRKLRLFKYDLGFEMLDGRNVAVLVKHDWENSHKSPTGSNFNYNFKRAADGKRRYLCVYLNEEDAKADGYDKYVYSFNDLVKLCLMEPYLFDGMRLNIDGHLVTLSPNRLTNFLYSRYLAKPEELAKIINGLTKDELRWFNDYKYDLVVTQLIDDKRMNAVELAVKWNKSMAEVKDNIKYCLNTFNDILVAHYN